MAAVIDISGGATIVVSGMGQVTKKSFLHGRKTPESLRGNAIAIHVI